MVYDICFIPKTKGTNIAVVKYNVPSWLSPQNLSGNSCFWAHDIWLNIAGTNESKSAQISQKQDKHNILLW